MNYFVYGMYGVIAGDRLAIKAGVGTHGVATSQLINCTIAQFTLYNAVVFGFLFGNGSGNSLINNTIRPPPVPYPGTYTMPLLSTVSDGIHFSMETQGCACACQPACILAYDRLAISQRPLDIVLLHARSCGGGQGVTVDQVEIAVQNCR